MSRRNIFILAIAILFLTLITLIVLLFIDSEEHQVRANRNEAINNLLSSSGAISAITARVSKPYNAGGSMDNLLHYLSKDPGRRKFIRNRDQQRFVRYETELNSRIQELEAFYFDIQPSWAPLFLTTVYALFEKTREDILGIIGIPPNLLDIAALQFERSAAEDMEKALQVFAERWVPDGRSQRTYQSNRKDVRAYLVSSKKFSRRMSRLDTAWSDLLATLYNLCQNPQWQKAVSFEPALDRQLNELILAVLTADIHRRNRDILTAVSDIVSLPGSSESPGIRWMPNFAYYKNIPEISGDTQDMVQTFFFAKVNLGYTSRDVQTQTWLNQRKDWLADYFIQFFSDTISTDFFSMENEQAEWKMAHMKAQAIHPLNMQLSLLTSFGKKRIYGIRELALVRMNFLENP